MFRDLRTPFFFATTLALASCDTQAISETNGEVAQLTQIAIALSAILLVTCTTMLVAFALYLIKSTVLAGIVIGQFIGICMLLTMSTEMQLLIVGGLIGISLDKASIKVSPETPSTVIDSLAEFVGQTANSVQNLSRQVGKKTSIVLVRRGLWSCVASLLLFLLVGRVGETLGIGGEEFLNAVGLRK